MAKTVSRMLTFEQALQRTSSLCVASEHCLSDISEKLYKWGVSKSDADKILDTLVDEKYIDETRYAIAYANDKLRFSHWGRQKIKAMLHMKRICDADISGALNNLNDEEYMRVLECVIETKRKALKEDDSYETRAKIVRFALQRGFEMHEIAKFVSEY